jgi:hypothetical protein
MEEKNNHNKSKFTLDSLPKKQPYSTPDDYFKELPSLIQARVVKPESRWLPSLKWSNAWQYALPMIALAIMLGYFSVRLNNDDINVQAMIDEIPTEELINYITESDITTDELLSLIDINELDVDGMVEDNIELLNDSEWDDIIADYPEYDNEI